MSELKEIILQAKEPFVIKNKLDWDIVKWSLDDWNRILQGEKMQFRCGTFSFSEEPQWERSTKTKDFTFDEFLEYSKRSNDWAYFDYKYLKEWFKELTQIQKSIKWDFVGFSDLTANDSTIWIGSKGAHTPCHIDTYGCNLIAQVYGRKLWVLFPPETDLKPTRIPYEESSIFSNLNFFSPSIEHFKNIENCRMVTLEPGEVLFVPHGWWHYVENLEIAISINTWIPLAIDHEERLKESLVAFFMQQVTQNLDLELKKKILNPNCDKEFKMDTLDSANTIQMCKNFLQMNPEESSISKPIDCSKYSFLREIPICKNKQFEDFLKCQKSRFVGENIRKNSQSEFDQLCSVINAFTNPETIDIVKKLINK